MLLWSPSELSSVLLSFFSKGINIQKGHSGHIFVNRKGKNANYLYDYFNEIVQANFCEKKNSEKARGKHYKCSFPF